MTKHTTPPGPAGATARSNSGRGQSKQKIAERAEELRRARGERATQAAFDELTGKQPADKPFHERVRAAHPDPFDPLYQWPQEVPGLVVSLCKLFLRRLLDEGYTTDELREACADWNNHAGTTEPFWFGPLSHRSEFRYLAHFQLGLNIWVEKNDRQAGLTVLLDDPDTARLRFTTSRSGKKRRENSEETWAQEGQHYKRLALEYRNQNPNSYLDAAVDYIVQELRRDPAWQARSPTHVWRRLCEAGITAKTYKTAAAH